MGGWLVSAVLYAFWGDAGVAEVERVKVWVGDREI
mgnify:FL=1